MPKKEVMIMYFIKHGVVGFLKKENHVSDAQCVKKELSNILIITNKNIDPKKENE